jgi:hypothetical protein
MSAKSIKMAKSTDPDTMRAEYRRGDLGKGVRGKYYKQYVAGTNLVLLDPDVSRAFPDAQSVNDALRKTMTAAKRARVPSKSAAITGRKRK